MIKQSLKDAIAAMFERKGEQSDDVERGLVTFTFPHPLGPTVYSRRERRAAERAGLHQSDGFRTVEIPFEDAFMVRKRRRIAEADRTRRQRKGQRRFYEQQRQRAFADDTTRAQMAVLQRGPGDTISEAMHTNVVHAVSHRFRDELPA